MSSAILATLMHLLLLLFLPPLLPGVINKTKAMFAGRKGPPVLQPYYDLVRLLRKDMVLSKTTTWVFRAAPLVTAVAIAVAGLLVPLGAMYAPIRFAGDLVLFAYLLGMARFATTVAALDTGSSFEGMGAAREVTFACFAEPALFLAFLVLAKLSGSLSLTPMLQAPALMPMAATPVASLVLVVAGLFVVLLAENSRIPIDDPNTHLELTMIHEVMVLDHSGPLLGVILYGAAMKMFVLAAIVVHILFPFSTGWLALDAGLFIGEMLGIAVAVGVVESTMARLQLRHVPTLLVAAAVFCAFGFLLALR